MEDVKTMSGYYIQYKILTTENTVGADKNTVVAVKTLSVYRANSLQPH